MYGLNTSNYAVPYTLQEVPTAETIEENRLRDAIYSRLESVKYGGAGIGTLVQANVLSVEEAKKILDLEALLGLIDDANALKATKSQAETPTA